MGRLRRTQGAAGLRRSTLVPILWDLRCVLSAVTYLRKQMVLVKSRIGAALWRRARSNVGIRFTRFTVVAVASVAASQISLSLLLGPGNQTAGFSGGLAAMIGAGVSYVLSRWAWERKGRPDLLRETLPFWLVSVAVWVVLAFAAKLGVHIAASMNLHGIKR